ncbi:hypothetical protein F4805DRAFT_443508 [Annulohypoxylon moriforme]|nr:hypothetical protein F4805DRAFT_443508 [Annulohypoxylon moriforme]
MRRRIASTVNRTLLLLIYAIFAADPLNSMYYAYSLRIVWRNHCTTDRTRAHSTCARVLFTPYCSHLEPCTLRRSTRPSVSS